MIIPDSGHFQFYKFDGGGKHRKLTQENKYNLFEIIFKLFRVLVDKIRILEMLASPPYTSENNSNCDRPRIRNATNNLRPKTTPTTSQTHFRRMQTFFSQSEQVKFFFSRGVEEG